MTQKGRAMVPTTQNSVPDPDHQHPSSWQPSSGEDADLLAMLADAEATVERLQQEIDRRRHSRYLQYDDAVRLADQLQQAKVNWQQVRVFFESALAEYRSGASWGEEPQSKSGQ